MQLVKYVLHLLNGTGRRPGGPGALTVNGADPAPDARRGSGRLTAARSATAAIAATRTRASVMFGVIKFFMTHFLSYGQ